MTYEKISTFFYLTLKINEVAYRQRYLVAFTMSSGGRGCDEGEYLLTPKPERITLFPIKEPVIWKFYKKAEASYWVTAQIDMSVDITQWSTLLNDDERFFISHVLAFFAGADFIVNENLSVRFITEVEVIEAKAFYGFQMAIEQIHSETYAMLIDTLIRDPDEQMRLARAVATIPCIKAKAEWTRKWITSADSFAMRIVGMACCEGIFFSGSFCAIYWLKKRGLMPGLCFSNEEISKDEGLHCDFACLLYSMLKNRIDTEIIYDIVDEALRIEISFVTTALPVGLIGMNATLMSQYCTYCADRLIYALGYPKRYNVTNPFDWMELISLQGKTNFFEKRVSEYQKAGVMASTSDNVFRLDADF